MTGTVAEAAAHAPTSFLPSARMAIDRVTHYTQIVAGVTVFGIAGANLVTTQGWRPAAMDLLVLAVPMLIWSASWLLASYRSRARLQLIAFAIIALSPWLIPSSALTTSSAWIPTGEVTFAVIIVAIMSWPRSLALVIVFLTATFELVVTIAPPHELIQEGPAAPGVGRWGGVLYLVIVGTGLAFWRARWLDFAIESDEAFDTSERAIAAARASNSATEAQITANRWIHEHTLNTILAVSKGIRPESVPLLRELAEGSLRHGEQDPRTPLALPAIVRAACGTAAPGLRLHCSAVPDVEVSREVASVLRDAIVEALRNVERHAQAQHVDVAVTELDESIRVVIRDDGIGIDTTRPGGFGTTVVLENSLAALGGSGSVSSTRGHGTTVTIDVPLLLMPPIPRPASLSDQALGRLSSRFMAISPLYYGLLVSLLTAFDGTRTPTQTLLRIAFTACVLGNAIWWQRGSGRAFGYLSNLVLAAIFIVLALPVASGEATCTSPDAYTFAADTGLGALLVVTLGLGHGRLIWVTGAILTLAGVWSALALGDQCSTAALESLVGALTYLALVLIAVSAIFRAADTRRAAATADWAEVEAERVRTHALVTYHRALERTPSSATDFLTGIVDGSIDPTTPLARERALLEASTIRDYLRQSTPPTGSLLP